MARDQEYDNTNTGALFDNKRRRSNSRGPDWRGQITIKTPDGELLEYWVSCWEKESRNGDPFLSLALDPKEDDQYRDRNRGGSSRGRDDDRRSDRRDDRRSSSRDRDDDRRDSGRSESRSRSRDDERGDPRDRDDAPKTRAPQRDLDDEIPF